MSASEIDFASSLSALVLGTQSQPSSGREGHTMKYEVWVLTEKGHIAYQWTQYFGDSREVALQKVEEWLGKAEKIEVKPV